MARNLACSSASGSAIAGLPNSGADSVAASVYSPDGEMLETSLQCSVTDLQLCIALQSDSIFQTKNTAFKTTKMSPSPASNFDSNNLDIDEFFCLPSAPRKRDLQRSLWMSQRQSPTKSSPVMFHSQGPKRLELSSDGDISLDENALCFSPLKSINNLLTQTDSMSQSTSDSSHSPTTLLTTTKHNYFLAFQDDAPEQSGILDQSMGPLSPGKKLNDSGTFVCSSSSDEASKQLKCWSDVLDDENDTKAQESIVASLNMNDRITRNLPRSASSGDDYGYASSSGSRPNILNRIRPSPSLPLAEKPNFNSSIDTSKTVFKRSGLSAPDLSFLNSQQPPKTERLPLRLNPVEDWDSLQVLLPPQIKELIERRTGKPLSVSRTPSFASSKKFSRRGSLESAIPEESSMNDVCPTCFKVAGEKRLMEQSSCNCTPQRNDDSQEDANVDEEERGSECSEESERPFSTNLMDFSNMERSPRNDHVIIDLKQKRELITCLKAAVMGLIGFRALGKTRSTNLSRIIEQQFSSALRDLLEDGLKPGLTVWSGFVLSCSSAPYQDHLIPMQRSDPRLLSDEERFFGFIRELLRLGDLLSWLNGAVRNLEALKRNYSMDAFVFLITSVTKDLWEDLIDTLSLLNATISPSYSRSSAKILGGSSEYGSGRKQKLAARTAAKKFDVLPAYPDFGFAKKKPVERKDGLSPISPNQSKLIGPPELFMQPHLRMGSRWSDWTLSRNNRTDGTHAKVPNEVHGVQKSRKFPSMFQLKDLVL